MAIKISGIYLIRNLITNHLYVGQSVNIASRWRRHKELLRKIAHPNMHLQRACNIVSETNFEFTILSTCEPDTLKLCEDEQYWMDLLTPEYNICKTSGTSLGYKQTDEARRKISLATKGKPKSAQCKINMKKNWQNNREKILAARHEITDETRQKMSEAQSGEKHHFFGIKGEANPNFGREVSDEFRQKMSEIHKGEVKSEEHKAKIAATLTGVPLSEERKRAMRDGWKKAKHKQTPEQVAKRMASTKATKEAKKVATPDAPKRKQTPEEIAKRVASTKATYFLL